MWKSREEKNAKLVKKYGTDITRFTFASTPVLPAGAVAEQPVAVAASADAPAGEEAKKANAKKKKAKKASNSEPIRYRRKK